MVLGKGDKLPPLHSRLRSQKAEVYTDVYSDVMTSKSKLLLRKFAS